MQNSRPGTFLRPVDSAKPYDSHKELRINCIHIPSALRSSGCKYILDCASSEKWVSNLKPIDFDKNRRNGSSYSYIAWSWFYVGRWPVMKRGNDESATALGFLQTKRSPKVPRPSCLRSLLVKPDEDMRTFEERRTNMSWSFDSF